MGDCGPSIMEGLASRAQVNEQLGYGVLGNAAHADNRPDRIALEKGRDDCLPFGCGQLIHTDIMLERSWIFKHF